MNQASEFKYKRFAYDQRPLGPPHQRFPDMHPETRQSEVENHIYLETTISWDDHLKGLQLWWTILASLSFGCWLAIIAASLLNTETPVFNDFFFYLLGITSFFILLALITRPAEQPMRLYRPTQEVLYIYKGKVYRVKWAQVPIIVDKWVNYQGGHSLYTLEMGLPKGQTNKIAYVPIGGGKDYEEKALRDWEYYCRYMENGYVELYQAPEWEKTDDRRVWEKTYQSPSWQLLELIVKPFTWPLFFMIALLWSRTIYGKPKWPQEIIDMCENHPDLRGGAQPSNQQDSKQKQSA